MKGRRIKWCALNTKMKSRLSAATAPILSAAAVTPNMAGSISFGASAPRFRCHHAAIANTINTGWAVFIPHEKSIGGIRKMKKLKLRFEQDKTLDKIEIVVRAAEKDAQVTALLESLSKDEPVKLTVLDSGNRASVIDEKDIVFVAAEGKLVRVVTTEGIYKAKQSLQSIESTLSRSFLRVSRFEIINLKKVRKYDFTLVGTLRVEFDNGMETWASRRYIPLIKERLSGEEGYLC